MRAKCFAHVTEIQLKNYKFMREIRGLLYMCTPYGVK